MGLCGGLGTAGTCDLALPSAQASGAGGMPKRSVI